MTNLAQIARALDFIEDHLQSPIAVADMADAVGYSVYHFCRTFNQATHHTPYDYLMRRRLAEAAQELLGANRRVIDVALDYQFNSAETFSRAFRRVFDVTPTEARKQEWVDRRHLMPRLTLAHIEHIHKGPYLRPVLVERAAFRVAGVMTLVREGREGVAALWAWFAEEVGRCGDLTFRAGCYGIVHYPEEWESRGYTYMAAIEVTDASRLGIGWVIRIVPASQYARFVHRGRTDDLPLTLDYVWHTWLPKSGYCLAHPLVIERYDQGFQDADADEGEREILIPIG
jgi:AraC family transcriptional regulator